MSSYKMSVFVTTAIVLVVAVVLTLTDVWPLWVGVMIIVLSLAGALFLKRHDEIRRVYSSARQPSPQPPPAEPAPPPSTTVEGLVLPSAQPDYRFLLNATVLWRYSGMQGMTYPQPDQLAIDAIRERATRITVRESPAQSDLLAPRLATELTFPGPDRTGQLEVWAQGAALSIPDDDRERLRKLANVRKDVEVWEHERAHERNQRAYLREDVLSSTGSAVVWWLAKDVTRVEETVGLINTIAKLVAAAQDREVEPVFRTFVDNLTDPALRAATNGDAGHDEDLLDRLMAEIAPDGSERDRAYIADRLAILAADAGATDLARHIRDKFNAPDFTDMPNHELFDASAAEPTPDTQGPTQPNDETDPPDNA